MDEVRRDAREVSRGGERRLAPLDAEVEAQGAANDEGDRHVVAVVVPA